MDKDELLAARKYIRCVDLLAHIPKYYCDNNCSDINNCHCDNAGCFPPKLTIGRFSFSPQWKPPHLCGGGIVNYFLSFVNKLIYVKVCC